MDKQAEILEDLVDGYNVFLYRKQQHNTLSSFISLLVLIFIENRCNATRLKIEIKLEGMCILWRCKLTLTLQRCNQGCVK